MESDSDRQVLAALERSLRATDPILARRLSAPEARPTHSRGRSLVAALAAVVGICLMVAGSTNWVLLLAGTIISGVGIALVTRSVRRWTARLNANPHPSPARARRRTSRR